MIDYIALGMVLDKELTGYDIKKEIEAGIGNFFKASYGNLYPALKKLTDKGHISMTEIMQGNKLKKYYQATELGRMEFLEWLSTPPNSIEETQFTRIYFYGELPKEVRNNLLQEFEFLIRQALRQLQVIEKQFISEVLNDREYFEWSTLYQGIQSAQNMIRWLAYIREQKPLSEFLIESK